MAQGASGGASGRSAESSRRAAKVSDRRELERERARTARGRSRRRRHTDEDAAAPPTRRIAAKKKNAPTPTRAGSSRADQARRARIDDLESRIAECENAIRDIEQTMAAPGFYEDRTAAQPVIDRHQALMWEVGDLMHQWEELQSAHDLAEASHR